MTVTHNGKEWTVTTQELQNGDLILLYTCGRDQMLGKDFEAMVNKKHGKDQYELRYNGVVEKRGTWILCEMKRKELMKAGTHKKFKLEII